MNRILASLFLVLVSCWASAANFIQINTHEVLDENSIRARFSTRGLSQPLTVADAATVLFAPITPTVAPTYDPSLQAAPVEAAPTLVNGTWTQTWNAPVALTPAQLAALVPQQVTRAQARMVLYNTIVPANGATPATNLLAVIEAYIATATIPEQIAYNEVNWRRASANLIAIATKMGLTSAQLDALFIAASKVVL